jgi:hypothetical protein
VARIALRSFVAEGAPQDDNRTFFGQTLTS